MSRVLATVLALVGLGGCASARPAPAEPADPAPTGAAPAVDFTASVQVGADALTISYRLVNHSGGDLVALNRVPAFSSGGAQLENPGAVYVTGAAGGRVEVAKRAFAMPQTDKMSWNHAALVGATVVHDGQPVTEEFTVGLPLHRSHPYGDDIGDGPIALPSPVTEVVFCLGVVPAASLPPAVRESLNVPHLSATTASQHLFCSPPVKL